MDVKQNQLANLEKSWYFLDIPWWGTLGQGAMGKLF